MNHNLIYPMFAMVLLTFFVAIYMLKARVRAIREGKVKFQYFRVYEGPAPEEILKPARQFINLFEVPILFYVVCLAAMMLPVEDGKIQILAWVFVFFRIVQAVVHLGGNYVYHRMISYMAGWITLLAMWTLLLLQMS